MISKFTRAIICLIILHHGAFAIADKKEDFRAAYSAYQQYIEAGDTPKALEAAAEAYKLGGKVYGKKDINTAKLAINYATLLNDTNDLKTARKTLKGKLKVMEAHYAEDNGELVSLLIELGRANYDNEAPQPALDYFHRASTLLEKESDAFYRGMRNFEILRLLLRKNARGQTRRYAEQAYSGFSQSLQPRDARLGLASYQMAMWSSADGRYEEAVDYLNGSLIAFMREDGQMGDLERTVRTMLVNSLEMAEHSEQATAHCLALGKSQQWRTPARPLFMVQPAFSLDQAKEVVTGEVVVSFTVDAEGFVIDPRIASSSAPSLNQAALDGVSRYRYAPRFVDGSAVATEDVSFTVSFDFTEALAQAEKGKGKARTKRFSRPPLRGIGAGGNKGPVGGGGEDFGGGGGGGGK